METIKSIDDAVALLRSGNTMLYPTDTVYGLGCDATNVSAINKILKIKNRPSNKSMILLVASDRMLQHYVADVPEVAWDLVDLAEHPTTIIYPKGKNLPAECLAKDGSAAIRMIKDGDLQKLIYKLGKPIVSTSANISGANTPISLDQINKAISSQVDFILNLPTKLSQKASSIIKIETNGVFKIIRK